MIPCTECSACCHYEVQLISGIDDVPEHMTYFENNLWYMRKQKNGSCIALKDGLCSIYDSRPTVCRQFKRQSLDCYAAVYRYRGPEFLELALKR